MQNNAYAFLLAVITFVTALCCNAFGHTAIAGAMVTVGTLLVALFLKKK